jgi:hypothetical protein
MDRRAFKVARQAGKPLSSSRTGLLFLTACRHAQAWVFYSFLTLTAKEAQPLRAPCNRALAIADTSAS